MQTKKLIIQIMQLRQQLEAKEREIRQLQATDNERELIELHTRRGPTQAQIDGMMIEAMTI